MLVIAAVPPYSAVTTYADGDGATQVSAPAPDGGATTDSSQPSQSLGLNFTDLTTPDMTSTLIGQDGTLILGGTLYAKGDGNLQFTSSYDAAAPGGCIWVSYADASLSLLNWGPWSFVNNRWQISTFYQAKSSGNGTFAIQTWKTATCASSSNPLTNVSSQSFVLDNAGPVYACGTVPSSWSAKDVILNCTASDQTGATPATFTLTTNQPLGAETANASTNTQLLTDGLGNTSAAGPLTGVRVDKKAPSISINAPTATTYVLNQAVAAKYSCNDGGSGVATCSGPVGSGANIDTSAAGSKTFTVNATDNVGNASSQGVTYTVDYKFSGFLPPIQNPPTVNTGNVGRTYPVKFHLTDANGAFISALSAVQSISVQRLSSCSSLAGDPTTALPAGATGGTSLRYDTTANQYVYNWATPSTPGCYTLFVTLDSGHRFPAMFSLS
jgi:hypothetical protein